jgi:hypothetical protein
MKNQFSIIMFGLLGLCALACVLLVVVILSTGGHFSLGKFFKVHKNVSDTTAVETLQSGNDIIIPDRFKALSDTINDTLRDNAPAVSDTTQKDTLTEASPPQPRQQRFFPRYSCQQMVSAADLKQLLDDNRFFCQKSAWSKTWANPSGKGIRVAKEGLLLRDSIVIDSFTNIMWQRFSTNESLHFTKTDSAISYLNSIKWQGFDNWRLPKIEELMATLLPRKNRSGLYLPPGWNCNAQDVWSCNFAGDSLSVQWIWVARTALGRCNVGHPDTPRSLIAVRSM